MKSNVVAAVLAGVMGLTVASASFAQTVAPLPGHPRVNQVDARLAHQQARVQAGVAKGQITARQAARDTRREDRVATHLARNAAHHNGHITKVAQRRMNRALNRNSRAIRNQRA